MIYYLIFSPFEWLWWFRFFLLFSFRSPSSHRFYYLFLLIWVTILQQYDSTTANLKIQIFLYHTSDCLQIKHLKYKFRRVYNFLQSSSFVCYLLKHMCSLLEIEKEITQKSIYRNLLFSVNEKEHDNIFCLYYHYNISMFCELQNPD